MSGGVAAAIASTAVAVPSSSKYASLPDIDSAPDVYETPDVPAEIGYDGSSDSDSDLPRSGSPTSTRRGQAQPSTSPSDNIDIKRLDTSDARRRFGEAAGASALRGESNFPKRPYSRRLPPTSSYSAAGASSAGIVDGLDKETSLERLRRLRSEIEELEQEVRKEQAEENERTGRGDGGAEGLSGTTDGKGKRKEVSPAVILQQLHLLRGDLSELKVKIGEDVLEAEGESEGASALAQKVKSAGSLLSKLGLFSAPADGDAGRSPPVSPTKLPPSPTKAVPLSPTKKKQGISTVSQGELEKRVAEMEKALGASEADVDEANPLPTPLIQTLTRLDHLLTLLTQPRHLDSISRRVKVLVSDLERLHESRRKLGDTRPLNIALSGGLTVAVPGTGDSKSASGAATPSVPVTSGASLGPKGIVGGGGVDSNIPPDALQKIESLFTLLPRLDPLLPLTPRLLTRLRSLSSLHQSAANFSETLDQLKKEVSKLDESERGLNEIVEDVGKSMGENEEKVKGNLEGLETRLAVLAKRMDKLGL
ncbi:hypothetical protein T439DRAFT_381115 [Meredithblackwellia eburnea MCA 4105]